MSSVSLDAQHAQPSPGNQGEASPTLLLLLLLAALFEEVLALLIHFLEFEALVFV